MKNNNLKTIQMHTKLANMPLGKNIRIEKNWIICSKTFPSFHCGLCHFKERGSHCPQGKTLPLCFSQERHDRESIYFFGSRTNG